MFDVVIKGGKVVLENTVLLADVGINGSIISAIGLNLKGKEEIPACGCYIMPGLIDPHVHVNLDYNGIISKDDWDSISKAAAFGGNTMIVDFAPPVNGDYYDGLRNKKQSATGKSWIDFMFHVEVHDFMPEDKDNLLEALRYGASTVKAFTTYSKRGLKTNSYGFMHLLRLSNKHNFRVAIHAEDEDIVESTRRSLLAQRKSQIGWISRANPPEAEVLAIYEIASLMTFTGGKAYIVHVSVGEVLENLIALKRSKNLDILIEATPHHLFLNTESIEDVYATACTPPIREWNHQRKLLDGLISGYIDTIGTDHCPYSKEDRLTNGDDFRYAPCGVSGVETRLCLCYTNLVRTGVISINKLCMLLSRNVAKMLGCYPVKGSLTPGTDADIVVFDPDVEWIIDPKQLHTPTDLHPFAGKKVYGKVKYLFLRGNKIIENGDFVALVPSGEFFGKKAI